MHGGWLAITFILHWDYLLQGMGLQPIFSFFIGRAAFADMVMV